MRCPGLLDQLNPTIFIRVPQLRINKSMPVLFLRTTLLSGEE
ncbi:hypothetical protein C4J95_4531 [Pseudomonas orientalis]|nr:hypothetical protein C4J95_4531 [Pseudomonas orientalis]